MGRSESNFVVMLRFVYSQEEAPRRPPPVQIQQARPSPRPQQPQVFHSAEEVNIPLSQRRPQRPYEFDF